MATKRTKNEKPMTIEQANEMTAGYAEVSPDPIDPALWLVEGDGWTETHEPMGRAAFARLLADKCLPKTYDAGQGRRVTVPENDEDDLFDAIREQLSPQAVAAIAAHLQAAKTNNGQVNKQVAWFTDRLVAMLGAAEFRGLMDELGL